MNARFWTFIHDDYVKITLRPGQSLSHYMGGPTEEGWSSEATTWRHDGNTVTRQCTDDGCDCDGRLTRNYDCICPLSRLSYRTVRSWEGTWPKAVYNFPDWEVMDSSQRDYAAEAMGY